MCKEIRLACSLLAAAALTQTASAAEYVISAENSRLGFAGEVSGERFEGQFHQFSGSIHFDPLALAETRFDIEIGMSSVDTQSEERDEALATNEWFDPAQFPTAHFEAAQAAPVDDGYVTAAHLTIRSHRQPVSFQFRLSEDGKRLLGTATLNRTDWDLGGADWSDEELVSHRVLVEVDVALGTP